MATETDALMQAGTEAGAALFHDSRHALSAAMAKHAQAGGNPRDVALGFFSAYAGWFARHIGSNATQALLKDVAKIAKRSSH